MKTSCSLVLLASLSLLPLARADIDIDLGISAEIRLGKAPPPPPPEVVVVETVGPSGPPPWAPAHGFRRNHAYYYYPGYDVYYRPVDHTWFYLEGGNWRVGTRLPDYVTVDFGRSVSLTMDTDRPYTHHQQVVTYYPRGYFTKVKVKDRPDHSDRPHNNDKSPGPDRGPDKDHGKGKGKGRD